MTEYTIQWEGFFRSGTAVVSAKTKSSAKSKLKSILSKKYGSKVWKLTIVGEGRGNPAKIRGWVKARAVKIVRNKRGQAVAVRIKT